jgi:hypothetical protein
MIPLFNISRIMKLFSAKIQKHLKHYNESNLCFLAIGINTLCIKIRREYKFTSSYLMIFSLYKQQNIINIKSCELILEITNILNRKNN